MRAELPDDVWCEILSFFPYPTLLSISLANKYLKHLASSFLCSACTEFILSDLLHANTKQIMPLLKDHNSHLVHWCFLSDNSPIWTLRLNNARHALESFNYDIRNFLLHDTFNEMVSNWRTSREDEATKRQRTSCTKFNCIKEPLPTGMCPRHTVELLNTSHAYTISFYNKYHKELGEAVGFEQTIVNEKNWKQVLVEKPMENMNVTTWSPGFEILAFVYGSFSDVGFREPSCSSAVFVARLGASFLSSEERTQQEMIEYESDEDNYDS